MVVVDLSSSSIHSTSRTVSSNRSPHSSLWLGKIQSLPLCLWKNSYNHKYPRSSKLSVRLSVHVVYIRICLPYARTHRHTYTYQYSEFLFILHFFIHHYFVLEFTCVHINNSDNLLINPPYVLCWRDEKSLYVNVCVFVRIWHYMCRAYKCWVCLLM